MGRPAFAPATRSRRWRHRLASILPVSAGALLLGACGGGHRLADYDFASRSLAVVYPAPPAPELRTGSYDTGDAEDPLAAVVQAGSRIARDVEARKARARVDSAARRVDPVGRMASRTEERASRYLGTRAVRDDVGADYLLEVDLRRFGIEAYSSGPAYLFVDAEAVLLDARSGYEIWSRKVVSRDRLTPAVRDGGHVPVDLVTAGVLTTLSVDELEGMLERLADYASDVITGELREDLREVRRNARAGG